MVAHAAEHQLRSPLANERAKVAAVVVPLADGVRVIARGPQPLGEGLECRRDRVGLPVIVGPGGIDRACEDVAARHQRGAARHADGRVHRALAVRLIEDGAPRRERIEMRCPHLALAVGTDRLVAVIVRDDEDDVRSGAHPASLISRWGPGGADHAIAAAPSADDASLPADARLPRAGPSSRTGRSVIAIMTGRSRKRSLPL